MTTGGEEYKAPVLRPRTFANGKRRVSGRLKTARFCEVHVRHTGSGRGTRWVVAAVILKERPASQAEGSLGIIGDELDRPTLEAESD